MGYIRRQSTGAKATERGTVKQCKPEETVLQMVKLTWRLDDGPSTNCTGSNHRKVGASTEKLKTRNGCTLVYLEQTAAEDTLDFCTLSTTWFGFVSGTEKR